jgi:hypothetical protein
MLRAERAVDRRKSGDLGGVDAVIYSAMAAEAFPNDFAHMASIFSTDERDQSVPEIVAASRILTELEDQKAQTRTKYQVLYYILAKAPFPTDRSLWADFTLLLRLRNELVHPKPENIDDFKRGVSSRTTKLIGELRARNLTDRPVGAEPHDWSFILEDDERSAVWAEKTAKSVIQFVAEQAPPSILRDSYLANFIASKYLESRLWD